MMRAFWARVTVRATAEDGRAFWTKGLGVNVVRAFEITFCLFAGGGMKVEWIG